jgi:urea transport system ATP-binding protein
MNEVQNDPRVIEVYLGEETSLDQDEIVIARIAATMAWSDFNLTPQQQDIILANLSRKFAASSSEESQLKEELANFLAENIPLTDLVPLLQTEEEKKQVLKLSYQVISQNGINDLENQAYQELVKLLNLPDEVVNSIIN